jgi:hypothetical protein
MIEARALYLVLVIFAAFANAFFFTPNQIARMWERPDLPVHEIMRHFRYRARWRLWATCFGLVISSIAALALRGYVIPMIVMALGLISLACVDAVHIRRLSTTLPGWSPDEGGVRMTGSLGALIDLLFGKSPKGDGRGE